MVVPTTGSSTQRAVREARPFTGYNAACSPPVPGWIVEAAGVFVPRRGTLLRSRSGDCSPFGRKESEAMSTAKTCPLHGSSTPVDEARAYQALELCELDGDEHTT